MRPTRRLRAAIALVAFCAGFAVLTASAVALAGAALIGAWILTQQYRFSSRLEATVDALEVTQTPARTGVRTGDSIPVTLAVTRGADAPATLTVAVEAGLPTAATCDGDALSCTLEADESGADRTVDVSWPVAGHHRFAAATVTLSDGRFSETVPLGSRPSVTADPRGPRAIHIGEGGDRVATAYGDHEAGRLGSGIEPAELREYVPGDTADRIDWKATARLGSPHVREYEAETDRRTLLVVDHRDALSTGRDGETKLDYLRDVALATTASARRLGDPIGLITVGDAGVTTRLEPAATPATYDRIRRRLLDLEPTVAEPAASGSGDGRYTAADARRKLAALEGDGDSDDRFTRTLRPFYASREGYRERIESEPLYGAVRTAQGRGGDTVWTVLVTDDSRPAELRETVRLARSNGNTVLVLLAPTVLYEPGGLADVERAYERYLEFEELRRDLSRMNRVTALEVGPRDRLSTVLSAGGTRRSRGGLA